jgi:urease alpha subunit
MSGLAENNPIEVDGDNQRFGGGMSVRLSTKDSPFRREDDARKLVVIVDVVCGSCGAIDFDVG